MNEHGLARTIAQVSSDQAYRTRAIRRAKVVELVDGRFVCNYRGNQVTVGSSWPGKILPEQWVDLIQGQGGTLEIAGPTGYAGG